MKVVLDEKLIKRNAKIGQIVTVASLATLGAGMFITFQKPDMLPLSIGALLVGFLLSQVGFTNIRILNSPLSRADPYGHLDLDNMVEGTKLLIELISRLVFVLSAGMLVIGPSILIWAQKPLSK